MDLTFIVRKDGNDYLATCMELSVVARKRSKSQAVEALKEEVEAYLALMIEEDRTNEISRPMSVKGLREFLTGKVQLEEATLLTAYHMEVSFE